MDFGKLKRELFFLYELHSGKVLGLVPAIIVGGMFLFSLTHNSSPQGGMPAVEQAIAEEFLKSSRKVDIKALEASLREESLRLKGTENNASFIVAPTGGATGAPAPLPQKIGTTLSLVPKTGKVELGEVGIPRRGSAVRDSATVVLAERLKKLNELIPVTVTDVTGGGHKSPCHRSRGSESGNCADVSFETRQPWPYELPRSLRPTQAQKWDKVCKHAKDVNLDVWNETGFPEEQVPACGPSKKNKRSTGPHLHMSLVED